MRRLFVIWAVLVAAAFAASVPAAGASGPATAESSPQPEKRIVGGSLALIEDFPWQVAIADSPELSPGDGQDRQFCGGSLVAPTLVISAAHCFFDNPVPGVGFNDPSLFSVISGRTELSSEEGQESPVAAIYAPVDESGARLYDPATDEWDVVLVELEQPSMSTPIKLAGPTETDFWAPGNVGVVTGWGAAFEGDDGTDELLMAEVDMLSDQTCLDYWGGEYFPETMLCAGVLAGGRDTCQGDSGGPLVVAVPGDQFRLVGDTSFGDGCARANTPAVYGRLADDPVRTTLQFAAQEIAGVNIVGSTAAPPPPPPPGPSAACLKAESKVEKFKKKLKQAKRAVERKDDKQKARKKVKRVRRKLRGARELVALEC